MPRVTVRIVNSSNQRLRCTDVTPAGAFSNLFVGDTIAANGSSTYTSDDNDRIFATFTEDSGGIGSWQLAMTCPKMSDNSACGSYNSGLQEYGTSGSASFEFDLGTPNQADWDGPWDHTSQVEYNVIVYGDS